MLSGISGITVTTQENGWWTVRQNSPSLKFAKHTQLFFTVNACALKQAIYSLTVHTLFDIHTILFNLLCICLWAKQQVKVEAVKSNTFLTVDCIRLHINPIQTCAPHEKAFSILRINFRILQSFSVVFLVAPPIAEIGLKNKQKTSWTVNNLSHKHWKENFERFKF